jgi:hypothetical protein
MHLLQWTQKDLEQHHGMESFPHHGHIRRGGSPKGLMDGHKCNGIEQESKDGGDLTWSTMQKNKYLRANRSMG